MTARSAAKALAKGAPWDFQLFTEAAGIWAATFQRKPRFGFGPSFTLPEGGLFCRDDSNTIDERYPCLIETTDVIELDCGMTEVKPGQVAFAAYYDGWTYAAELVIFRQGRKGVEGFNRHARKWIPLKRFRIVAVVTGHGITSQGGSETTWRSADGVDFTEDETMRRDIRRGIWAARILKRQAPATETPLDLIEAALGTRYLGPIARPADSFAVYNSFRFTEDASGWASRLYFEEATTLEPRDRLLCLIAHTTSYGEPRVEPARLIEREGELWATIANEDDPIAPGAFRYLRACVGVGNPDGVPM